MDICPSTGAEIIQDLNESGWGKRFYPAAQVQCSDLLEHLDDPVHFLDECWDALVPGGVLSMKVGGWKNPSIWRDPTHKRPYDLLSFDFFDPDTDLGQRYGQYTDKKWWIFEKREDGVGNILIGMVPRKEEAAEDRVAQVEPSEGPHEIEIVTPYRGWCLENMVSHLVEGLRGWDVGMVETPTGKARLTYHFPWHTLLQGKTSGIDVALFTHLNPGMEQEAQVVAGRADHLTTLSCDSQSVLWSLGADMNRVSVIRPGLEDGFGPRKIRIGTSGRPYPNGRKRQWIFEELAWRMDLSAFEFILFGPGWNYVVDSLTMSKVAAEQVQLERWDEYIPQLQALDYYLATGFTEGGPLGVMEALACGVPVLSYPTGYANDLPEIVTVYQSIDDLAQILSRIADEKGARVSATAGMDWNTYVAQHQQLFERLLEGQG